MGPGSRRKRAQAKNDTGSSVPCVSAPGAQCVKQIMLTHDHFWDTDTAATAIWEGAHDHCSTSSGASKGPAARCSCLQSGVLRASQCRLRHAHPRVCRLLSTSFVDWLELAQHVMGSMAM